MCQLTKLLKSLWEVIRLVSLPCKASGTTTFVIFQRITWTIAPHIGSIFVYCHQGWRAHISHILDAVKYGAPSGPSNQRATNRLNPDWHIEPMVQAHFVRDHVLVNVEIEECHRWFWWWRLAINRAKPAISGLAGEINLGSIVRAFGP